MARIKLPPLQAIFSRAQPAKVGHLISAGDAAMRSATWKVAIDCYEQILKLQPGLWKIRVQLGHAFKELGDLDNAAAHYRLAHETAPDSADPMLHLGHVCKLKGETSAAFAWYSSALAAEPGNVDARFELRQASVKSIASLSIDSFLSLAAADTNRKPAQPVIYWDISEFSADPDELDEEGWWFRQLARLAALDAEVRPVLFDAVTGACSFPDSTPVSATGNRKQPAGSGFLVVRPAALADAYRGARLVGTAHRELKAKIICLVRSELLLPGASGLVTAPLATLLHDSSVVVAEASAAPLLRDSLWRHGQRERIGVIEIEAAGAAGVARPAAARRGGFLIAGIPAAADERALIELQLQILRPQFSKVFAVATSARDIHDHSIDGFCHEQGLDLVSRTRGWNLLEHEDFAAILFPGRFAHADLWAIRADTNRSAIFADLANRQVFDVAGANAGYFCPGGPLDLERKGPTVAQTQPNGQRDRHQPTRAASAWLRALSGLQRGDPVNHLTIPMRTTVQYGTYYSMSTASRTAQSAAEACGLYLLTGDGWISDGLAGVAFDGDEATITVLTTSTAGGQQIVCQALIEERQGSCVNQTAPFWRQFIGDLQQSAYDGVCQTGFRFNRPPSQTCEKTAFRLRGIVFYPADRDHYWFEFLDRLSRIELRPEA